MRKMKIWKSCAVLLAVALTFQGTGMSVMAQSVESAEVEAVCETTGESVEGTEAADEVTETTETIETEQEKDEEASEERSDEQTEETRESEIETAEEIMEDSTEETDETIETLMETEELDLEAMSESSQISIKEASEYLVIDGYTVTGLTEKGKKMSKIVIPEGITIIGHSAFWNQKECKEVILPESLLEIQYEAFYLSGLQKVTIPKNVRSIGFSAFGSISNLSEVKINSKNVKVNGSSPFSKTTVGKVTFAEGMTRIPAELFSNTIFKNYDFIIPATVTTIEKNAFYCASGFNSIQFAGNQVKTIQESAFYRADVKQNLIIPNSVTTIEKEAYAGTNITEITIPASVSSIGTGTFWFCKNLKTVTINSTKLTVDYGYNKNLIRIFDDCAISQLNLCNGMTKIPLGLFEEAEFKNCVINIPDSVKVIEENAFKDASGISKINFGANSQLTTIEQYAFQKAKSFNQIQLPKSLKTIGGEAFEETDLLEIQIPSGVTSIGYAAFRYCKYLDKVILPKSVTSIGENAFAGVDEYVRFYVTSGSYAEK